MAEELGLFEAIHTQRALRYIKPDPIPDELVRKVLDAGIRAPSGGNQQKWRFIVIKDAETKRWIQPHYAATGRPAHAATFPLSPWTRTREMARDRPRELAGQPRPVRRQPPDHPPPHPGRPLAQPSATGRHRPTADRKLLTQAEIGAKSAEGNAAASSPFEYLHYGTYSGSLLYQVFGRSPMLIGKK